MGPSSTRRWAKVWDGWIPVSTVLLPLCLRGNLAVLHTSPTSINKPTTPASPWLPDITFQKITFIKVTSPHLHWMNLCIIGRLDYICDGEILCWRACYKTQEWDDLHATCEASDKPLKSEMDGLLNMNHLELSQRTADERSVSVWSTHLNSLWWYWFGISVLHIKSPQIYSTGNRWTM